MAYARNRQCYTVFTNQATATHSGIAGGVAYGYKVSEFKNCILQVGTSNSANLKVFVKVACGQTPPDFASSASKTNQWSYAQVVDIATATPIDGATGIVYSGTDSVKQVEININCVDYICFEIANYSAGQVTAYLTISSD